VSIVSKSGERKTVVGPKTVLLEYDEDLEPFNLSTGRPKGEGGTQFKQDVYLRVHANKVSDIISASTHDLVDLKVAVSYRVSFLEQHKSHWFAVENYTKLLCEHLASKIRNKLKHYKLNQINNEGFDIIRACVLGEAAEERGVRPGALFEENGMKVYDVEIFDIKIADSTIATQIDTAQRETVRMELEAVLGEARLEATKKSEAVERQLSAEKAQTAIVSHQLREKQIEAELSSGRAKLTAEAALAEQKRHDEKARVEGIALISQLNVARQNAEHEAEHKWNGERQALAVARLGADTDAYVKQIAAINPELSAKIKMLADSILGSTMIKELGAHSLLRGQTIADVLAQIAQGAPGMEQVLRMLPEQVQIGKLVDPEQLPRE